MLSAPNPEIVVNVFLKFLFIVNYVGGGGYVFFNDEVGEEVLDFWKAHVFGVTFVG